MTETLASTTDIPRAELIDLYRTMVLIRKTEEQLVRCVEAGQVPGGCHTYIGQEAVATLGDAHLGGDSAVGATRRPGSGASCRGAIERCGHRSDCGPERRRRPPA